jgi:hypothetical protein
MTRPLKKEFLEFLQNPGEEVSVGVKLARLCVEANIPFKQVAAALGVTRMTVHHWCRGQDIRRGNRAMVVKLNNALERDLENKVLPVRTPKDAAAYLDEVIKTFS